MSFLDLKWNRTSFCRSDYSPLSVIPEKPVNYEKMIEIARKLSKGIPHVRIDLYEFKFREFLTHHFVFV